MLRTIAILALVSLGACSSSDDQCRMLDPKRLREVDNTNVEGKTLAEDIKLKWEHPAAWAVASTKELLKFLERRLTWERREKGAFPASLKDDEVDAWGESLRYEASLDRFRACSSGVDAVFGTTDDLCVTFTQEAADAAAPTCKKFIATYAKCIDDMPEAARGPARDGLKQMQDAWSLAPKDSMEAACQQAWDASKRYMSVACPGVTW